VGGVGVVGVFFVVFFFFSFFFFGVVVFFFFLFVCVFCFFFFFFFETSSPRRQILLSAFLVIRRVFLSPPGTPCLFCRPRCPYKPGDHVNFGLAFLFFSPFPVDPRFFIPRMPMPSAAFFHRV